MSKITAPNGAKLEYDLDAKPGYVKIYAVDGVCQHHFSGFISEQQLKRHIKTFCSDHSPPVTAAPQPAHSQLAFTD